MSKLGRNLEFCKRYKAEGRQEKNQKRRVRRHVKQFPNDKPAVSWLTAL